MNIIVIYKNTKKYIYIILFKNEFYCYFNELQKTYLRIIETNCI